MMNNIFLMDEIVNTFSQDIDVISNITPINLNNENDIFLQHYNKGLEYNPQYIYSISENIGLIKKKLNRLVFKGNLINDIYNDYRHYIIKSLNLIESVGKSNKFTDLSIDLHGKPSKFILAESIKILEEYHITTNTVAKHQASYLKKVFLDKLDSLKYSWDVVLKNNMSSKVAVDSDKKIIYINEQVTFSDDDVQRLLVHEIGTHVVRAENGAKQKYGIFRNGFPNSIETEEGLATYNEYKKGVLDIKTLRIYAGRVLAVDLCMNKSFFDTFKEINKYFDEQDSLRIVSRVKRGLTDTTQIGGYTKDFVYLNGYYKIKNHITPQLEKILYTGVVGIDDAERVTHLT